MKFNAFYRSSLITVLFIVLMAGQSHAELSPDAQAAIKKGIMAAKEQEWDIAIQSFQDARKITPNDPVIFYNLGLAESKVPGRELRAIAWFGAYLSASPNAPNAAAVNDFISGLQIKNEGNMQRLIKFMQDAFGRMPSVDQNGMDLYWLISSWVEINNVAAAMNLIDLYPQQKEAILGFVVQAQVADGDIAGARKTTDLILDHNYKIYALNELAKNQAKAGDIAGAQRSFADAVKEVGLINTGYPSSDAAQKDDKLGGIVTAEQSIVEAQIEVGDIIAASKTVTQIQALVDQLSDGGKPIDGQNLIQNSSEKSNGRVSVDTDRQSVAKAQALAGDVAGAKKTVDSILILQIKSRALIDIAEAQAASGDITGAQNTLASAKSIADALQGDDPGVKRMIEATITSDDELPRLTSIRNQAEFSVREAKSKAQPHPIILYNWIFKLDDSNYGDCPLNTAPFLELSSYLTAQHSDNPQILFSMLNDTAEKIIKAQNIIYQMLKQQAKEQSKP